MEELEIRRVKELATIESKKFEDMINAIGTDTISKKFLNYFKRSLRT